MQKISPEYIACVICSEEIGCCGDDRNCSNDAVDVVQSVADLENPFIYIFPVSILYPWGWWYMIKDAVIVRFHIGGYRFLNIQC